MSALLARLCAVLVALAIGLGLGRPAEAAPRLEQAARAGRVTVMAEPGLERIARQLAEGAEATLARIAADLDGLKVPHAIEVRLVADAADLDDVAPPGRGAPAWAIGVAYPDLGIVSVALRRDGTYADAGATLRHELAHIALGVAIGPRAPHWLHEGFAYQHSAEWSADRVETLAGMAWFDSVIPLEALDASFPREELPAHRAYAESYDFVGFLSRRGRWEDREDDGDRWPFRRFLHELGTGAEPNAAAHTAFNRSLHQLFEEWRLDLATRYRLVPMSLVGLAAWILIALLLVAASLRRRRQNRARLAQWELEDQLRLAREREAREARERMLATLGIPTATPEISSLLN